jgi:hypothetical protein
MDIDAEHIAKKNESMSMVFFFFYHPKQPISRICLRNITISRIISRNDCHISWLIFSRDGRNLTVFVRWDELINFMVFVIHVFSFIKDRQKLTILSIGFAPVWTSEPFKPMGNRPVSNRWAQVSNRWAQVYKPVRTVRTTGLNLCSMQF